ncbi:hypothetical protein PO909_033358 [Leuciscus waleckii]
MNCFWPNRMVDEFFIRVHRHYFHDCSLSGRLLHDPPNRILGPFIVVPILLCVHSKWIKSLWFSPACGKLDSGTDT